jgi:hypothetical protein
VFGGQYGSPSSNGSFNFSYSAPYVAEINQSGQVVQLANFLDPSMSNLTKRSSTYNGTAATDFVANYTANTTNATGAWNTSNALSGSGWGWAYSSPTTGAANLSLIWHVVQDPSAALVEGTYHLKFDVILSHWPWRNPHDRLGMVFSGLAPEGAQFGYSASNRSLSSYWNGGGNESAGTAGGWFSSVQFGADAGQVSQNRDVEIISVAAQSVLSAGGTPDRVANVLLTFNVTSGNTSTAWSIEYDPYMYFAFAAPPVGSPGGGSSPSGSTPGDILFAAGVGAVVLGALAVIVVFRRRRSGPRLRKTWAGRDRLETLKETSQRL